MDFEVCHALCIQRSFRTGSSQSSLRIGTPHYMAPEVMRGHGYGTEAPCLGVGR